MKMPKYELFLGFPVEKGFSQALEGVDDKVKEAFIKGGEHYLTEVQSGKTKYLGRFIGAKCDLQKLHNVEDNIYSLLKRLTPDFPFNKTPLKLFPAEKDNLN